MILRPPRFISESMQTLAALTMLASVIACGGATSPDKSKAGPAARIAFLNAPATAKVNSDLPITVHVADANGVAVAGQLVNFVVVSGGGHVFAGSGQTTASGDAKDLWTLGLS